MAVALCHDLLNLCCVGPPIVDGIGIWMTVGIVATTKSPPLYPKFPVCDVFASMFHQQHQTLAWKPLSNLKWARSMSNVIIPRTTIASDTMATPVPSTS